MSRGFFRPAALARPIPQELRLFNPTGSPVPVTPSGLRPCDPVGAPPHAPRRRLRPRLCTPLEHRPCTSLEAPAPSPPPPARRPWTPGPGLPAPDSRPRTPGPGLPAPDSRPRTPGPGAPPLRSRQVCAPRLHQELRHRIPAPAWTAPSSSPPKLFEQEGPPDGPHRNRAQKAARISPTSWPPPSSGAWPIRSRTGAFSPIRVSARARTGPRARVAPSSILKARARPSGRPTA